MRKTLVLSLCVLCAMASLAMAKNVPGSNSGTFKFTESPATSVDVPADVAAAAPGRMLRSAAADTFHLAWYSFDVLGTCNPQGWVKRDRTSQDKAYFHVAREGNELDGGTFGKLHALEGLQSMWCGQDATAAPPWCGWATLPGYGNSWDQELRSKDLSACDSVVIYYRICWDSEPGYDFTTLEILSAGAWSAVGTVNGGTGFYDGTGILDECIVVGTNVDRIRFHFTADGAWSDEDGLWPTDGAVTVDSITIEWFNNNGTSSGTFYEDFEGEAEGALVTDDGCWQSLPAVPFGEFGDLYQGLAVLQEDPCFTNFTCFWGWFDPNGSDYICNGPPPIPIENHPGTKQVPFGPTLPGTGGLYLYNEIWSPLIPNVGVGDQYTLSFLTYRDLPLDNLMFYIWSVRSWVAGCPGIWENDNFVFFGGQKDWLRTTFNIGSHVNTAASDLQIALGAIDACAFWCGVFGTGVCHSHAPLIDEVHLVRINVVGPQWSNRHLDLFQDTFTANADNTGTGRADSANDIAPSTSLTILPGDSCRVTVNPVGPDPKSGEGPGVYLYAAVWPQGQPGKSGPEIEAPETRGVYSANGGKRYPLVDSLLHDGTWWYCFRMDSTITGAGAAVADQYCADLNDNVFEPCDTICYIFCADDGLGSQSYWHRNGYYVNGKKVNGQGGSNTTSNLWYALDNPCEFQVLPGGGWKSGGDILYVDDSDDRGGPVNLFFDVAFDQIGILEQVDRYDVLGPSSNVGNSLASRATFEQLLDCYRKIIWCSGNLSSGLLGDGAVGSIEKSDDYGLIIAWLDNLAVPGGFYFSGDDIHSETVGLTGGSAVDFRTRIYTYNLLNGNHVLHGEDVSPCLFAVGPCFLVGGIPDSLIAFGGCPLINDFDVMTPTGTTLLEFPYPNTGDAAVMSSQYVNNDSVVVGVVGSGFSYHYIRDKDATQSLARSFHLVHILRWLQNILPDPTGIGNETQYANYLGNNYPNPFNPTTTIKYGLKDRGHVSLKVYNVAGQLVRTLVNEVKDPAAIHTVTWDGRSNAGHRVSSGVYFYKLVAKGFTQTKKMVLLK